MQGLFKSVLKGQYKKLPKQYSKDLNTMIRVMLNVTAAKRPSCSDIMAMPEFLARAEHLYPHIAVQVLNRKSQTQRGENPLVGGYPSSQYKNRNNSSNTL